MPKFLMILIVTSTFFLIAGCERQEDSSEDNSVSSEEDSATVVPDPEEDHSLAFYPSNDWECSEESARAVTKWLKVASEWPTRGFLFPRVDDLPEVGTSTRSGGNAHLVVAEEEFYFDDHRFRDLDELRQGLQNKVETWREEQRILGSEDPMELAVAVQSDVAVPRLAESLEIIAESNVESLFFVFATYPERRRFEAMPEKISDKLMSLSGRPTPENREQLLVSLDEPRPEIKAILDDCPDVEVVADALTTASAEDRGRLIREKLPQAWLACDCGTDIEFLTAIYSANMEIHRDSETYMLAIAVESSAQEALAFLDGRNQRSWGQVAGEFAASDGRD